MADTDLVFTTAETSSWEFLSCGLPVGLACAVDNQMANYQYVTAAGLAIGIGELDSHQQWKLDKGNIEKLVTDPQIRMELARRARSLVDIKGSAKIVEAIVYLNPPSPRQTLNWMTPSGKFFEVVAMTG